jgi:uncharacterized protein YybS (DUF2232 family)
MSAPKDNTQLVAVFGFPEYNNFNEEVPFTNEPGCLIGFTTSFLALSWIFVCLRLFVRLKIVRMPGWDDLFVFLYLIFTSIASVAFLVCKKDSLNLPYHIAMALADRKKQSNMAPGAIFFSSHLAKSETT